MIFKSIEIFISPDTYRKNVINDSLLTSFEDPLWRSAIPLVTHVLEYFVIAYYINLYPIRFTVREDSRSSGLATGKSYVYNYIINI